MASASKACRRVSSEGAALTGVALNGIRKGKARERDPILSLHVANV